MIREEIESARSKRDQINQKVSKLKEDRIELKTRVDMKQQEYIKLKEKIRDLLSKTSTNKNETESQIKALDWKIQTSVLSQSEEIQIINQIKALEQQCLTHKKTLSIKEKTGITRLDLEDLITRGKELQKEMSENAIQSQEYHNNMLEKIKEAERIRREANYAHQDFIKYKETADINHTKYLEILNQINIINLEINTLEEGIRKKQETEKIALQAEIAYKKLKEKKKLTFEEFQTLMKKGRI